MTKELEFVKGESVQISFTLTDPDTGSEFTVLSTDVLKFGIETAAGSSVFNTSTTGATTIALTPADTGAIQAGRYFYDVGLKRDSDYYVIIQKSVLIVIDNVTSINS